MDKDEIIRMAREAGGCDITSHGWTSWVGTQTTEFLERFAALVAAHEREKHRSPSWETVDDAIAAEREACAKVCDAYADKCVEAENWEAEDVSLHCAAAIRARGDK